MPKKLNHEWGCTQMRAVISRLLSRLEAIDEAFGPQWKELHKAVRGDKKLLEKALTKLGGRVDVVDPFSMLGAVGSLGPTARQYYQLASALYFDSNEHVNYLNEIRKSTPEYRVCDRVIRTRLGSTRGQLDNIMCADEHLANLGMVFYCSEKERQEWLTGALKKIS